MILISLSVLLAGCAVPGFKRADPGPEVTECLQFYEQTDAVVRQAGVADRESAPVRGFPYLRTNRHLASFGGQPLTAGQTEAWLDRLRG